MKGHIIRGRTSIEDTPSQCGILLPVPCLKLDDRDAGGVNELGKVVAVK